MNRYIRILPLAAALLTYTAALGAEAVISSDISDKSASWVLENEALRFTVRWTADNGIELTEFRNKTAGTEVTGTGNVLFDYQGKYLSNEAGDASRDFHYTASEGGWELVGYDEQTIAMSSSLSGTNVGRKLIVSVSKDDMQANLHFELYNDNGGLRYQAFIKNLSETDNLLIERSDVLSLDIPQTAHNLHYVLNSKWFSTTGNMEEASMTGNANDVAKCFICLNDDGTGWYMAPETNWKTQYGPEEQGKKETPSYYYQLRPFATMTAWAASSPGHVKVLTSPESLQLNLFPGEEFEYIAVNLTAFKGDIIDGKMAVENHFRRRFHFHDTATSMMVNDWEWFRNGYRTEEYLLGTVVPKAVRAGYDMLLIDDGWNNSTSDGKWITEDGLTRDPIESNVPGIPDMADFSAKLRAAGLRLGLWYSNSGGGHNNGNDLADPEVIAAKKTKIETMIDSYGLTHQAVDLTQYWQNLSETAYSHPSDNVYRKNVLTRNMMNEIVDANPSFEIKVTSELDLYPNPGDRMTELLHLPNNGWMTITGNDKPIEAMGIFFGHLPLNAVYLGSGGDPAETTDVIYAALSGRDVKAYTFPDKWSDKGIELTGKINRWRKNPRVTAVASQTVHPVWLGTGCTSADASQWKPQEGPYVWMYMDDSKRENALIFATSGGRSVGQTSADYPLRWLDPDADYIVEDVTLDDTGIFTYAFKGRYKGRELNENGLKIDLSENTSQAKAYWVTAAKGDGRQIIFADENVTECAISEANGKATVEATGTPSASGKVIVYGHGTTMTCDITFDSEGHGSADITDIHNNDIAYPGKELKTVRIELEDYNQSVSKSNEGIKMNRFDNGNPDSEHGYSSVAIMTTIGDYVTYRLPSLIPAEYKVTLNYKLSTANRGKAQFYINGTAIGDPVDESTTGNERMVTVDLGTYKVTNSEPIELKMELVGGGMYIGANYIVFTPCNQPETVRMELEDYNGGVEKSADGIKMNSFDNGNPDSEHGFSSVAIMTATGDYVVYTLPALKPASYKVTLNYKLSQSNRGIAQFYINGKPIGEPINESTTGAERMVTAELGTIEVSDSEPIKLKMEHKGGGMYIGANYIVFTPVSE